MFESCYCADMLGMFALRVSQLSSMYALAEARESSKRRRHSISTGIIGIGIRIASVYLSLVRVFPFGATTVGSRPGGGTVLDTNESIHETNVWLL